MHTCIECGSVCYCDMEDHENPMPADCSHVCDDYDSDDDFYDYEPVAAVPVAG
jgi:hypothetical protein